MQKLQVKNIHKAYGQNQVLKGVSLDANAGDVTCIIGSSGSGKSTFLRCINFLEIPDQGSVQLNDQVIHAVTKDNGTVRVSDLQMLRDMRTRLTMVFQHFNLWGHMNVLQNVMEAPTHVLKVPKKEAMERARHYLNKVGLPTSIETQYPAHLSGGQQQRVAIARALAMEPEVMLFDEPTSALDPELVGEVLKVMQQLAEEGRTMLIVTHEIGFARQVSNNIVFLHQGVVEESGTPSTVLDTPQSERLKQFLTGNLK